MKNKIKLKLIILSSFFAGLLLLGSGVHAGDTNQFDQGCVTAAFEEPLNIPSNILSQTFTPSLDHLTEIKIYVNGDGGGKVGLKLYRGDDFLARTELQDEPFGYGEVILYFDDIALTPGDNTYKIRPYVDRGNMNLSWYRRSNCYANGKAFEGNVSQGYDFGFSTHGYNFAVPEGPLDEVLEEDSGDERGDIEEDEEDDEGDDEEEEEGDEGSAGEDFLNEGSGADDVEEDEGTSQGEDLMVSDDEADAEESQGQVFAEESDDYDRSDASSEEGVVEVDIERDGFREGVGMEVWSGATKPSMNDVIVTILFVLGALVFAGTVGYLMYDKRKKMRMTRSEAQVSPEIRGDRFVKMGIVIAVIAIFSLLLLGIIWFVRVDDRISALDFEFSREKEEGTISGQQEVQLQQDDVSGWLSYDSSRYGYHFDYPQVTEVKKATKEFFSLTPEEYREGITTDDKIAQYSEDICLILEYMSGTIRISASPNKNKDVVMCTGITGIGSDCAMEELVESVQIGQHTYGASGSSIDCPGGAYREVFVINFDDGASIEYILRKSNDMTQADFDEAKEGVLRIISTFRPN